MSAKNSSAARAAMRRYLSKLKLEAEFAALRRRWYLKALRIVAPKLADRLDLRAWSRFEKAKALMERRGARKIDADIRGRASPLRGVEKERRETKKLLEEADEVLRLAQEENREK
jgi:hypothetical protein